MSKEQIFLTESEHAVQKIAHACARANNSSNPVLDVALAIEEIVYEKAQDVAGDLEIWESEHAMMVYKQICSTLIARLPSVRRLCSARPSLLVEKLLKVSKVPLINCVPQSYKVHQGVTKGGWKQLFPHSYALTSDTCWRGYGGKADFQA